ncbi:Uncharacterized protein Rs2_33671 [Raphanus sativus]|nr:Uncharacterized protein Rs2_33671 [Raphanus sativus]
MELKRNSLRKELSRSLQVENMLAEPSRSTGSGYKSAWSGAVELFYAAESGKWIESQIVRNRKSRKWSVTEEIKHGAEESERSICEGGVEEKEGIGAEREENWARVGDGGDGDGEAERERGG